MAQSNESVRVGMYKEGGDLYLFPMRATNATFRIDNVVVKATFADSDIRESVTAGMGFKLGKAAQEHIRQMQLRDGVKLDQLTRAEEAEAERGMMQRASSGLRANFNSGPLMQRPFNPHPNAQRGSEDLNDAASSRSGHSEGSLPETPKRTIVPKFGSADPAFFSSLAGLQTPNGGRLNPYPYSEEGGGVRGQLDPSPPPVPSSHLDDDPHDPHLAAMMAERAAMNADEARLPGELAGRDRKSVV